MKDSSLARAVRREPVCAGYALHLRGGSWKILIWVHSQLERCRCWWLVEIVRSQWITVRLAFLVAKHYSIRNVWTSEMLRRINLRHRLVQGWLKFLTHRVMASKTWYVQKHAVIQWYNDTMIQKSTRSRIWPRGRSFPMRVPENRSHLSSAHTPLSW